MLDFHSLTPLLAMGSPSTPPGTAPNPTGQMVSTFGFMAIMFAVFYLLLIRPQQKKAKELATLLKSLRAGDKVVTSSGIVGVIISVKERTLILRSNDTKMEITKGAVAEVTERSGDTASES
jgi:preprotein translocase subunit YajC